TESIRARRRGGRVRGRHDDARVREERAYADDPLLRRREVERMERDEVGDHELRLAIAIAILEARSRIDLMAEIGEHLIDERDRVRIVLDEHDPGGHALLS